MKKIIACLLLFAVGCVTEEVEPPPAPVAAFTASLVECFAPCEVSFTNTSQNADAYTWDFKDGNTSAEASPKHLYETGGAYQVTLTAKGAGGTADSTLTVQVWGIEWDKSFGDISSELLSSVIATPGGGFLLMGLSESTGELMFRIDNNGNLLWSKSSGSGQYWPVITVTSDGGFLIGRGDFGIGKTDANGNEQWSRSFGGMGESVWSVVAASGGGFLLGGTSASASTGHKTAPHYGGNDYWIVRIDANGDKLWDKSFGGSGSDELRSMAATSDGGFLLAGSSSSSASGNKTAGQYGESDYWIVKIDGNGNKIWDKSFGGSGGDILSSFMAVTGGGFLLAGSSNSSPSGNKSAGHYGSTDYWIVRTDGNGNKLWDKNFGGSGEDSGLWAVLHTSDNGFLLGGSSDSAPSGNKSDKNYGFPDYWVVKTDADGNKVWDKSFGGNSSDYLYSAVATSDGGFLLGGWTGSSVSGNKTSGSYGQEDYWVVKIK